MTHSCHLTCLMCCPMLRSMSWRRLLLVARMPRMYFTCTSVWRRTWQHRLAVCLLQQCVGALQPPALLDAGVSRQFEFGQLQLSLLCRPGRDADGSSPMQLRAQLALLPAKQLLQTIGRASWADQSVSMLDAHLTCGNNDGACCQKAAGKQRCASHVLLHWDCLALIIDIKQKAHGGVDSESCSSAWPKPTPCRGANCRLSCSNCLTVESTPCAADKQVPTC